MLKRMLDCLESGISYSQDDLAKELHADRETVSAGIEYLARTGYLKQIKPQSGCSGSCKGCPGCGPESPMLPVFWERIK